MHSLYTATLHTRLLCYRCCSPLNQSVTFVDEKDDMGCFGCLVAWQNVLDGVAVTGKIYIYMYVQNTYHGKCHKSQQKETYNYERPLGFVEPHSNCDIRIRI